MSHEIDPFSEFQFVIPSGELVSARVTPEWKVEIGDRVQDYILPDSAICLAALAVNIDRVLTNKELTQQIGEVNCLAVDSGALPNPIIDKNGKILSAKRQNAFNKLIYPLASPFRPNIFTIAFSTNRRTMFLSNAFDEAIGLRVIDKYAHENDLSEGRTLEYTTGFSRQFNSRDTSRKLAPKIVVEEVRKPTPRPAPAPTSVRPKIAGAVNEVKKAKPQSRPMVKERYVPKKAAIADISDEEATRRVIASQGEYAQGKTDELLLRIKEDKRVDMDSFLDNLDKKGYSGLVEKRIYDLIREGVLELTRERGRKSLNLVKK